MTDRIDLTGIEVFARHGVYPSEKERAQVFKVDVSLFLDLSQAGRTDDLADTVDYGAVTRHYGPCQVAFIVLPLVSAVFVDLATSRFDSDSGSLWQGQ